eukprot:5117576-Lingulodinium_polyedra.AAC.1
MDGFRASEQRIISWAFWGMFRDQQNGRKKFQIVRCRFLTVPKTVCVCAVCACAPAAPVSPPGP